MGRWGTLVAVCANGEMPPLLREQRAELCTWREALRGAGWQVFETETNLLEDDTALTRLLAETGSPVVAAQIADSDYGWLVAISPAGRWGAWLDPRTAYAFERDFFRDMDGASRLGARRQARAVLDGFGMPAGEASRHAVRWAAEAGLVAAARPVRQVLTGRWRRGWRGWLMLPSARYDFAEDRFFDLLDRLGIPAQPTGRPTV